MAHRTGTADWRLHGGRVPEWLASRMARLGRVIAEAIVLEYGRPELLRRLAHVFWFQSFGAVIGIDPSIGENTTELQWSHTSSGSVMLAPSPRPSTCSVVRAREVSEQ
jgi:hypothetical protein